MSNAPTEHNSGWQTASIETVYENKVISVKEARRFLPGMEPYPFVCFSSNPWVNVVAVTPEKKMVLIRQWRHGSTCDTLEIPGGLVDPGEDPAVAGARELREETGYTAQNWSYLGSVNPNPALFDNRCHTFLALDARPTHGQDQDEHEQIEVLLEPVERVRDMVREGDIDHSLVVAALALFWLKHTL